MRSSAPTTLRGTTEAPLARGRHCREVGFVHRLTVAVLVLAILASATGCEEEHSPRSDAAGTPGGPADLSPAQQRELERIATLGYVVGADAKPARSGVLTHDPDRAFDGLTLFTSGEAPYAVLIDMEGNVVHSWEYPGSEYWARVHLLEGGDLLVITCGPPQLLRLDHNSELVWRYGGHAHHDLAVMRDGTIAVLVRTSERREELNNGELVIDDNVVFLDLRGRQQGFVSLLEAFERSQLGEKRVSDFLPRDEADIFHTNSIEVLSAGGRRQLLLSLRSFSTVAILDVASGKIVWALAGRWHKQHEAQMVDGNLLLFDNLGLTKVEPGLEQSRVLEIDTGTLEVVWSFTEPGFFTRGAGAQQRLPNGNTLITESESGRIIEVTPEGAVVWEYVNPATVPQQPELLPGILRAERLERGFRAEWLAGDRRTGEARRRDGSTDGDGRTRH
jgi:hypothetical protein